MTPSRPRTRARRAVVAALAGALTLALTPSAPVAEAASSGECTGVSFRYDTSSSQKKFVVDGGNCAEFDQGSFFLVNAGPLTGGGNVSSCPNSPTTINTRLEAGNHNYGNVQITFSNLSGTRKRIELTGGMIGAGTIIESGSGCSTDWSGGIITYASL